MQQDALNLVPSLDLKQFVQGNPQEKQRFVADIGKAFQEVGFVTIRNHPLSEALRTELYQVVKQFFDLSDPEKLAYQIPGIHGQRGYTPKGKEHAKGRSQGDLKEFYHIGQELEEGDSLKSRYPDNVFPQELPQMETICLDIYRKLEETGRYILQALALHLGLEETYFESQVEKGNSILRAIHYYPIEDPSSVEEGAVRAAAHGDINLITLLMGASAEGLQILTRDEEWVPVTAQPDELVVNVGDMLERLSNNRLRSTIHRVVNPPVDMMHTSRYSVPFFMHPRSEMDLSCLEGCIDGDTPKAYPDITAGEFLDQRLREIGLK